MKETINIILTYLNTIVIVLALMAGGWVKIRDYFKAKAAEKASSAEAEAEAAEAAIQARINAAVAAATGGSAATVQTATSADDTKTVA